MKKSFLILLFASSLPATAHACLRIYEEAPTPVPTTPSVVEALNNRPSRETWVARVDEHQKVADKEWNFGTQNNLSVALAHAGRLDEALQRMQTVERTFPGHYFTSYNMGTVYELRGDLPHALEWMKKGLERELTITGHSPLDGTEWLHLRILESQIEMQKTPNWLDSHSVSGLDFGSTRTVDTPTDFPEGLNHQKVSLATARRSLFEQLHERLEFVQAPNPVVGSLLADLGNIVALESQNSTPEDQKIPHKDAADLYQMALSYRAPHANLLQSRFDFYAGTPPYLLYTILISLGSIGALYALWLHYQREKHAWEASQLQLIEEALPRFQAAWLEWGDYNPYAPLTPTPERSPAEPDA